MRERFYSPCISSILLSVLDEYTPRRSSKWGLDAVLCSSSCWLWGTGQPHQRMLQPATGRDVHEHHPNAIFVASGSHADCSAFNSHYQIPGGVWCAINPGSCKTLEYALIWDLPSPHAWQGRGRHMHLSYGKHLCSGSHDTEHRPPSWQVLQRQLCLLQLARDLERGVCS